MTIQKIKHFFLRNLSIIGITALASAAVVSAKLQTSNAAVVQHGASISKGCENPKMPGDTVDCHMTVGYNDQGGDTISIDSVWDLQAYLLSNQTRVPAVGSLPIMEVSGNTTCTVGGSLPCLIGPAGSTLSGLPGTGTNGSATFHSGVYVVQEGDPNPLPDQANATVHDLCDAGIVGCNNLPNNIQFTSNTIVVSPTPTNTPTSTPTNTPTPTPTNTPTPTATPTPATGCTLTQGYWKNHPSDWPVSSLTLGTVSYTKDQLLTILKTPVKGNGLISLAHQLIAAKLNIASGASGGAITSAITDADNLIGGKVIPPVGSGFLSTASTAGLTGSLDNFNNGISGPGHCGN